ncbi:DinB family protein [Telmatospirillum sp. J64-1]|uniref:DinB family protein n=1 Tax=Telmatospirillum sp. J64-1 TaxID=2502183 RepID=UPI00115F57D5|nr:DinB family protein [Telmatospirillum sp. J64-1]
MDANWIRILAGYNAWANHRLYGACGQLPEPALTQSRPSFFGTILGTLNHVLVGDRIWLARIEGREESIPSLDHILHQDFAELFQARKEFDARIIATVAEFDDARLAAPLIYRNMAGEEHHIPLGHVLGHVFNHQTHHRGQVHDMLSHTQVSPPSLDLIRYLREA